MLTKAELNAAVAEGIISRGQAIQLADFADRLARGADERAIAGSLDQAVSANPADEGGIDLSQDPRDEPFRLLKGFRDVFIALGIAIFAVGIFLLWVNIFEEPSNLGANFWLGQQSTVLQLVAEIVFLVSGFLLAEWVTRKQRLPLTSLVLSIAIAVSAASLALNVSTPFTPELDFKRHGGQILIIQSIGAAIGLMVFYARYRLPFVLLPLAGAAVTAAIIALVEYVPGVRWNEHSRFLIGGLGVAVFLAAMWFDMKDRLRVTRFSECAFWLHLLAAPLMVHAALAGNLGRNPDAALVFGAVAVLAVIALVIDRRALLVSGLTYLAVAIARVISAIELFQEANFAATAAILGAIVIALGLAWTPVRRGVLTALPIPWLKARVPPVAAR